jgi:hypothetical protein
MGVGLPLRTLRRPGYALRVLSALIVLLLYLPASRLIAPHASAQEWSAPRTVYVPTTGHTTDGLFLDVWRVERDLLGDPVTEEFAPRTGFTAVGDADVVQYYEHLGLIYLPDEVPERQVQALDLGRQALADARDSGATLALQDALQRAVCAPGTDSCLTVVATGHTVRGPFLAYWQEGAVSSWLGYPLTEAFRAPDGTRVQYFENGILRLAEDGLAEPLPLGRISAQRAKIDTRPVPQPDDVPIYDESLFIDPNPKIEEAVEAWGPGSFGPGPQQGAWKEIVVSISAQAMWAYENGELVVSTYVSTGTAEVPETTTPIGYHSVIAKVDVQTMEGTISGEYYRVEDVPHVMYFDNLGNAIHGTYWHSNFGAPMSHGCVNLPLDIAAWMYEWAPVGTAVTVIA